MPIPLPTYGNFGGNGEHDAWVWADRYADFRGVPHPARDPSNLAFVLEAAQHYGRMPEDQFDWAYFLHDVGSIPDAMLSNILNHIAMAESVWDALLANVYGLDLYQIFYGPGAILLMTLVGIPFEIAREAYDLISGFVGDVIGGVGDIISDLGGFFSEFGGAVGDFFGGIGDFIGGVLSGLGDLIGDFIDRIGDIVRSIGEIIDTIFPVVLDLDGDGVELISAADSNVVVDGSHIGWVGAEDGILAFDANGNGLVDGLSEISLVSLAEGAQTDLEGLAGLDSNQDGVIDASDEGYSNLLVWRDLNGDGQSSADEVMSLAQAGIASIALGLNGNRFDSHGNRVFNTTEFVRTDGSRGAAWDVGLSSVAALSVRYLTDNVSVTATQDGFSLFEVVGDESASIEATGGTAGAFVRGGGGDDQVNVQFVGGVVVETGSGADVVTCGDADDALSGGDGDDVLSGAGGGDLISGGSGDDRLIGGQGADRLSGGDGHDVFVFTSVLDSAAGSEDRILDFDPANDFIDLSGLDADGLSEGRQGLIWIDDAFSGQAGEARLSYDEQSNQTRFEMDSDGDCRADFTFLMDGLVSQETGWIL